jgi:hypothetical protein
MVEINYNNKNIQLRDTLFWDVEKEGIDAQRSKALIIERVLTRGNMIEFKQLIRFYTQDEISQVVVKIAHLDPRSLNFISGFLNIPRKDFLCYKKRASSPKHWNS